MQNQQTKTVSRILKRTVLLITLAAMLGSCASISSFFKGSGRKYKHAAEQWENGLYARSLSNMVYVYENDDNYTKAKVFVRDHYAEGVEKTLAQIAEAKTIEDPMKRTEEVYELYKWLGYLNREIKKNVPIVVEEEWEWEPEEIIDYTPQQMEARKEALDVRMTEAERLFGEKKSKEARSMIKKTMDEYLTITDSSSDTKKEHYAAAAKRIASMVDRYAASVQNSGDLDVLKDARKTLELGLDYSPENQALTARKDTVENRMADLYVAEGREIAQEGGLEKLKEARSHYKKSLRVLPENPKLTQALGQVNRSIADAYYEEGYALEQKGDDESMKAAISKYKAGLEYAEGYEKLLNAIERTKNTVAEKYYQKALAMEPDVGEDPVKAKEVVAVYEQAQSWVEDYKDTDARIAKVMAQVQVNIYVVANSGSYYDVLQNSLEKALDRKVSDPYMIYGPEDTSGLLTAAQVDSNNFINPAKTLGAKFVVVIKADLENPSIEYQDKEDSEKFYWAVNTANQFQKLDKAEYKMLKYTEDTQGRKFALEGNDLKDYGDGTKTVYTQTREVSQKVSLNVAVYNIQTERRVFNQSISKTLDLGSDTRHDRTSIPYKLRAYMSRDSDMPSKFPALPSRNSQGWVDLVKKNDSSVTRALSGLTSGIISTVNSELSN